MVLEQSRKDLIVNLYRAGHTETQIIKALNCPKTTVYRIIQLFKGEGQVPTRKVPPIKVSSRKEEVKIISRKDEGKISRKDNKYDRKRTPGFLETLKRLIKDDPQVSQTALAKKMKVARATIRKAINDDLGFKNYRVQPPHRQRGHSHVNKELLMASATTEDTYPDETSTTTMSSSMSTPPTTTTTMISSPISTTPAVTVTPVIVNNDNKHRRIKDKVRTDYWTEFQMRQLNCANKDLQGQLEILRSKNRELTARLQEKETQLEIAGKQINNLRLHLKGSQDSERERFRELDLYRNSPSSTEEKIEVAREEWPPEDSPLFQENSNDDDPLE